MSEKHQCECRVNYGDFGRSRQCKKTGAYEHEGKHYCKTHHPPTVLAKRQAKSDKWNKEWDEKAAAAAKAKAEALEQKRRAECFPDLLEALRNHVAPFDGDAIDEIEEEYGLGTAQRIAVSRAAIRKATGEQQ